MGQKTTRFSSRTRAAIGILAAVIILATPFTINQLRQNQMKADEESKATTPLRKSAERGEAIEGDTPGNTIQDLVRAWNQGRTNEIAKMFASDGVLIIPARSQIQSRAEIEKAILEGRAGVLKDTRLSNTVENVSQSEVDHATVKGTYQLEGIKIFGFTKSATGSFILHQIKHQGQWLISRAELTKGSQD